MNPVKSNFTFKGEEILKFVMLDLETLGNGNNAVIIQIAAVIFNPFSNEIFECFDASIDPQTAIDAGLDIDISTIEWWFNQPNIYKSISENRITLEQALQSFSEFYNSFAKDSYVCGNGVAFDNVILRNAYRKVGIKCPWHYRQDFDLRTLRLLYGKDVKTKGDRTQAHNAIADCLYQIEWASPMIKEIMERTLDRS